MTKSEDARRPYVPSQFFIPFVVDPISLMLGGPSLTVRGRRSGRAIGTPVPPFLRTRDPCCQL